MFRSLMTIIRELYLHLTSYIYVKTLGKKKNFSQVQIKFPDDGH